MSFFLSSISSEVLSLFWAALLAFFGLTSQPPFPSVVLTIPGGEQSRPDQKIQSLRKFLHRSFQSVEVLLLFSPVGRLLFSLASFVLVLECRKLPQWTAADVLSDYPPILLAAAGVVESAALPPFPWAHQSSPRCVTPSPMPRFSSDLALLERFDSAMRQRPSGSGRSPDGPGACPTRAEPCKNSHPGTWRRTGDAPASERTTTGVSPRSRCRSRPLQRVAMILTHANHSFVNACRASPSKRFCVADCEAGQLHCKPLMPTNRR